MITQNLIQGTEKWHAYRAAHDNASDAPAMMGESSYKTRDQLIAEAATGIVPDVDAATQRLFDSGHRFEDLARPRAEAIIGQDLYPCTGSLEGSRLSASFDGLTMLEDLAFEHKRLNQRLRAAFADMETVAPEYRERQSGRCLPLEYQIQMEQQCAVSGCEKVLFMATHWADDGTLLEQLQCWYFPNLELRARIVAGWEQFHKDVAAWVPPEAAIVVKPTAKLRDSLPVLVFDAKGEITASNVDEFKTEVLERINGVNLTLETDQDFADGESDAKWLRGVSAGMKAAIQRVRTGMVSVNEVLTTLEQLDKMATDRASTVEKQVKSQKDGIKAAEANRGEKAFAEHMAGLNVRLGKPYMPKVPTDFQGAIKNKRTVESLRSAVNDELARAKIAANEIADRIQMNLTSLRELATAHAFLFADAPQLVMKANDDLLVLIKSRIGDHEAKEAARLEAERERIRQEEQAKAQREAQAAEAQRERERQEELRQQALQAEREAQAGIAEARAAEALPAPLLDDPSNLAADLKNDVVSGIDAAQAISTAQRAAASMPAVDVDSANLLIGGINRRLGYDVNALFLKQLGFEPVRIDGARRFFRDSDLPLIGRAIAQHTLRVTQLQPA